ncbi:MAG: 50S ribosomal protein L15 [Candidatus Doudnabacteria bacterium]|nr:50S ribosomal protein L15 [Candidatus Doudnabacteria bacterium]
MLKLHTIKKHPKSTHRKKVVGRGLGSGRGTYSTRGGKGQTARTGHTKMPVGFAGGSQPLIRQLPKNRGFTSPAEKARTVRLDTLIARMREGGEVSIASLKTHKLLPAGVKKAKIVGIAVVKAAYILKVAASESAKKAVVAAGGSVK